MSAAVSMRQMSPHHHALSLHSPLHHTQSSPLAAANGAHAHRARTMSAPGVAMSVSRSAAQRRLDYARLREMAKSDEFSDSESDGEPSDHDVVEHDGDDLVDAAESDSDIDEDDVMFLPFRRSLPSRSELMRQRQVQMQKKKEAHTDGSPKGDDWTIVDKSPTFESVSNGPVDLGESWFVARQP